MYPPVFGAGVTSGALAMATGILPKRISLILHTAICRVNSTLEELKAKTLDFIWNLAYKIEGFDKMSKGHFLCRNMIVDCYNYLCLFWWDLWYFPIRIAAPWQISACFW